jgi:hypothetical protein
VKIKRKRVKLSKILAGLHGRYKWVGAWPAIPVKLRWDELAPRREPTVTPPVEVGQGQPDGSIKRFTLQFPIPPDAPPAWVENIYERLFEKILPPKQRATEALTVEFYDAAIFGYAYAALSRERASRLKACKTLPPDSPDRLVHEELVKHYTPTLEVIRRRIDEVLAGWELPEAANYLEGFAYGIACQQREAGWTPSATTETLQIYKALVQHQHQLAPFIHQNKHADEIADFLAEKIVRSGISLAESFANHPYKDDRVKLPSGDVVSTLTAEGRRAAEKKSLRGKFRKHVATVLNEINFPLPPPGRPAVIPTREK